MSKPSPQSADVGRELGRILGGRHFDALVHRRTGEYRISLSGALTELESWLVDGRTYKSKHHDRPWATMAVDVREVLST